METHEVVVKVDGEEALIVQVHGDDQRIKKLARADAARITVEVYRVEEERVRLDHRFDGGTPEKVGRHG